MNTGDHNSRRTARYIAIGCLVVLLIAAATAIFGPLFMLREATSEISAMQQELATLRERNGVEPHLRAQRRILTDPRRQAAHFIDGATIGVAEANLQKLLVEIIDRNGGQATSVQILPGTANGGTTRVSINLSIRADIVGLRGILHRIETGLPLLFVDQFSARAPAVNLQRVAGANALTITMRVSGYLPQRGPL